MAIDVDSRASTTHLEYDGKAGRTHTELAHVPTADGRVELAKIHRAVNAATDPELESLLLDGVLNRLPDGRELAVPLVYHHPQARRFVLLVPSALAHESIRLRAQLMLRVSEDTAYAVPAYVVDCTTVVGLPALRAILGIATSQPVHDSEVGELRRREDALALRIAELEASQRRLGERETVLEQRLSERDSDDENDRVGYGAMTTGGWQEVQPLSAAASGATVVGALPVEDAFASADAYDSPVAGAWATRPPPLPSRSNQRPPPLRRRSNSGFPAGVGDDQKTVIAPFPVAIETSKPPARVDSRARVTMTESAVPPPLPSRNSPTRPPPLRRNANVVDVRDADASEPEPITPPETFDQMAAGEMAFSTAPSPWLFVRFDEAPLDVHREHRDLLVQYQEIEGRPVVVLSLLLGYGENEHVHRALLDPHSSDGAALLSALASAYQAKVSMYLDDDYLESREVASLREGVVQQVIARAAMANHSALSWDEATSIVWDNLPPVHSDDLPFGPPKRQAASTASVLSAVERLARWMQPAKLEEAALLYSVPQHVIDASAKRCLGAAASYGIALPIELAERAIVQGVAPDQATLVRGQLTGFAKRVKDGSNDLGPEWTAANWQRLFDAAERNGVPVDEHVRELESLSGDTSGHSRDSRTTLLVALNKAAERVSAAEELLRRHDVTSVPEIVQAMSMLEPTEVARLMARVVQIGDEAGDGLLVGLISSSPAVRQSAALALGRMRLRRALGHLLKQLLAEPTDLWTEIARAIGEFGPSAVRTVARSLSESRSGDARFAQALAHLTIHGALPDVRKLEHTGDARVAKVARDAVARASRVKWEDAIVRDGGALPEPNPEAELAQEFFSELRSVPGV